MVGDASIQYYVAIKVRCQVMNCHLLSLSISDGLAAVAIVMSVIAVWRTERERARGLLRECHARASQIEREVARDVYEHMGFISFTDWSEELEDKYLECRQIYRRSSGRLRRVDRRELDRMLEIIDETTLAIRANSDDGEEYLQKRLQWRAEHLPDFIRALARALHRAAYHIRDEDLPPDDDPGVKMLYAE